MNLTKGESPVLNESDLFRQFSSHLLGKRNFISQRSVIDLSTESCLGIKYEDRGSEIVRSTLCDLTGLSDTDFRIIFGDERRKNLGRYLYRVQISVHDDLGVIGMARYSFKEVPYGIHMRVEYHLSGDELIYKDEESIREIISIDSNGRQIDSH